MSNEHRDEDAAPALDEGAEPDYRPSWQGLVAARLVDLRNLFFQGGKLDKGLTLSWSPRVADISTGDLENASELVCAIVDAVAYDDRAVIERLRAAADLLRAAPKTQDERLAAYAEHLERLALGFGREPMPDGSWNSRRVLYFARHWILRDLARDYDPRLAELEPARLSEQLEEIASSVGRRGGRGNEGSSRLAAELAVEVKAFGSWELKLRAVADTDPKASGEAEDSVHDRRIAAMTARIQVARSRQRKARRFASRSRADRLESHCVLDDAELTVDRGNDAFLE